MPAPNKESYRIMGIDPGTNYMGYGVVEVTGRELRSVVMGAIDLHKLTDPYAKLRRIFDRVGALVDEYAPREATNATRGWAAAARPRRRTAANRGKNSSKRTPTANSNVDPVPPRRPSRTVSRPRIRLSQPTRFQAVVRPLHPLSERFSRRSAILITFRNFQTKFSYELQFYRINSNHCVTNLKKLKKNS